MSHLCWPGDFKFPKELRTRRRMQVKGRVGAIQVKPPCRERLGKRPASQNCHWLAKNAQAPTWSLLRQRLEQTSSSPTETAPNPEHPPDWPKNEITSQTTL